MNPVKIKEQLVNQLKTQISDLERFIQFLQGEVSSPGPYGQYSKNCKCNENGSAFPIFNVILFDKKSNQFHHKEKNENLKFKSNLLEQTNTGLIRKKRMP